MRSLKKLQIVCIILGVALYMYPFHHASASTNTHEKATEITLESFAGELKSLKDYRGKKVAVHFFSIWCHPCQEEMPYIAEFAKRVEEAGGIFIPVHLTKVDQGTNQLQAFLTHYQADFDPLLDKKGEMMNMYTINGIPTTIFLDENGQVEKRINGMLPKEAADAFIHQVTTRN
ncbi:TlpA family protein disulfide reductase [Alkalicoccobacillus porphyridii]|uniref:TlpA family protein disulfide reductase n=1 Tax=Alkalicoccobacillus porphyridii TaxID=2597270 RepID=A0A553ZXC7_9BACI|nr:TlpA disulfide reductase family protein [Alkalicoccobacillus porphyridii]TSB46110.1 TlpA family protein disulfide reductase [Alkalicoccobacillus porphyridii]